MAEVVHWISRWWLGWCNQPNHWGLGLCIWHNPWVGRECTRLLFLMVDAARRRGISPLGADVEVAQKLPGEGARQFLHDLDIDGRNSGVT